MLPIENKQKIEPFIISLSEQEINIAKAIEPVIINEGFELVCIKAGLINQKVLISLFLDKPQKRINIKELGFLHGLISDVLAAANQEKKLLLGDYSIETSSPGIERLLCKISHFKDVLDKKITIKLNNKIDNMKNISGILTDITNEGPRLDEATLIPWKNIKQAKMAYTFPKAKAKAN